MASYELHRLALGAALVTLAACGGGGGGAADVDPPNGAGPGTAALPTRVDYAAPAKPLNVTVALDATAVQQLDVPLAGGTLAVTGANGTRYTLVIPGDALRSPTRIRMQAVGSIAGLPGGIDAIHGVQLEPAGLRFVNPATLTIEPAVAVPLAQQAFYGHGAAGADLHPLPGELGAAAQIKVAHFSGYGMATLARERSVSGVFVNVVPAGLEARLQAAMATAFMQARDGTIGQAQLAAAIESLLTQYESEVLGPQRAAAGRSCANAITAFSADLSYNRQRQLLGLGGDVDTALKTMKTLRSVCFDEANKRCRVSGNIEQLIVDHLGLQRQSQLLGDDDAAASDREEAAIDKCGRYEFQFDSTLTFDGVAAIGFGRLSVATRVPIKLAADFSQGIEGNAMIDYTDTASRMNCSGIGCSYYLLKATFADTATVRKGLPRFAPQQGIDIWALGTPVAQTGTFSVDFDPGRLGEDVDVLVTTPNGIVNANMLAGLPPTRETLWSGFYSLVNQGEIGAGGAYAWSSDFTPGSYPVMFERATAPSLDNRLGHFIAITRVKLVHKPV